MTIPFPSIKMPMLSWWLCAGGYTKDANMKLTHTAGFPPNIWKKILWHSLTWTQISMTICDILQEVLPGAWNDNFNIFQVKTTFFFMIISIFKKVTWIFREIKNVPLQSLTTFFPDFPGWWEPCRVTWTRLFETQLFHFVVWSSLVYLPSQNLTFQQNMPPPPCFHTQLSIPSYCNQCNTGA